MKTIELFPIVTTCLALVLRGAMGDQYYGRANYGYSSTIYGSNAYVDSSASYYDGYAQAWRYLGWYVDCNGGSSRYYSRSAHSHSGSHDQNSNVGNNYCQRYLMWAAYVDENYSGGGIGEYAIFDTTKGYYDSTACDTHGNGNCKLMDCHDPASTNWKLIGVFKEASYFGNDAFFEQLFKHEGVCVWNDEDLYEFMSETREGSWSSGCLSTGISNGNYGIYIDLKPTFNGNMTYALYTDSICSVEYEGNQYNVESVAANMGLLYGSYMEAWNDAMEPFKVCQPCRAYNLQNSGSSSSSSSSSYKKSYSSSSSSSSSSSYSSSGSYSGYWRYTGGGRNLDEKQGYKVEENEPKLDEKQGDKVRENERKLDEKQGDKVEGDKQDSKTSDRKLYNNYNNNYNYYNGNGWYNDDDGYDPNNGYFRCDDDADYSNVNQCMKFRSHAELEPATWEDLVSATNQGGILTVNVSGVIFGSPFVSKEQEEYLTYVRRQKEAAYAKELEAKAAKAVAAAPTAESAVVIGQLWIGFGALAFTFSVFRLSRQMFLMKKEEERKPLAEPLRDDGTSASA